MKSLALVVVLFMQTTGWWGHASTATRDRLTATATGRSVSAPSSQVTRAGTGLVTALPVQLANPALSTTATAAYAVDSATGTVLFAKAPQTRLPIASITKMVTALVVLSRHTPGTAVTIPALPAYGPDDERIGLVAGERYTFGDLIQAALVNSGNDAADALAIIDAGSTTKFAARMNAMTREWGISDTRFSNPTGLQDTGNYASAAALAKIAGLFLTNPYLRDTVGQSETTITSAAGRAINLRTTNQLLASGDFYGIKTGYTLAAGECFVGLSRIGGHEVITVVLGAGDRFGETRRLTNWIGNNWQWL